MSLERTITSHLTSQDPDLAEIFGRTIDDLAQQSGLAESTRLLVQLAAMIAVSASRQFALLLEEAEAAGVTDAQLKELVYQAVPYAGMGKALEALEALNAFLFTKGVQVSHRGCANTDATSRAEQGLALQKAIVGSEAIDQMYASAPADLIHLQRLLSANCFGDYVSRKGLDVGTRELLTLAMLSALGGCEPQVRGHVLANAHVGNGRIVQIDVITQLLPYIGYPRTLNAIRVINETLPA
jgi:4-carboxymuconolactone decarboxylase